MISVNRLLRDRSVNWPLVSRRNPPKKLVMFCRLIYPRRGAEDVHPSSRLIFLVFIPFSEKLPNRLAFPLLGLQAPCLGNPGSVTLIAWFNTPVLLIG